MPKEKAESLGEEKPVTPRGGVREAALREASAIVAESGVEALSLREVARRLGVSHQAPYRHFPSRDHILAAIVAEAYREFAEALDARERRDDPREDMGEMGRAYLAFALERPLPYRLMFGTPLPDPEAHPEATREARHAFGLLREALVKAHPESESGADLDALFVWSCVHGLATLLHSSALQSLGLSKDMLDATVPHVLGRIGEALGTRGSGPPESGAVSP